ncbi:MAG: hypothetical protein C0397_16210 [Odoribacter sp.]|nr:hypothetical protein [Odoribacter sp.]
MNFEKPIRDKSFLLNISYTTHKMNYLDSTDILIKKQNTEYFVHLIRIALADDVINGNEMELLHLISKKLGFTEIETVQLIKTTDKSDYRPPSEFSLRFEQVFEIVNMSLADRSIIKDEMRLASSFATKCGFEESEIPALLLLLLNGIRQGKNKSELLKEYQNKLKS